ncbi:hypothetical protein ACRDU6_18000 [Mycolicibacterium sp. ELW1]|uniref:hypothetical protein n=1 Tax=Mycobacteriaceae TaxID=1762 RepID=UPI0011F02F45|nr:hypothetical protein [Mycobacterium sp. ELW1]QEN14299.1 hypothetical protein D3H54_14550 [Mycobacterium sp. ELW1]
MNRTTCRLGVVVAFAGLTIIGLPGCSPGSSAPAAGTTSTRTADAAAGCTKAEFADAATTAVHAVSNDNIYRIDDVTCADGWAVTSGLWSSTANPDMGAPSTLVFQQHGGQWISQDKQKVCGTNASATPAPADATIPAALYELGCLTG